MIYVYQYSLAFVFSYGVIALVRDVYNALVHGQ
jgi:hypothetical protein